MGRALGIYFTNQIFFYIQPGLYLLIMRVLYPCKLVYHRKLSVFILKIFMVCIKPVSYHILTEPGGESWHHHMCGNEHRRNPHIHKKTSHGYLAQVLKDKTNAIHCLMKSKHRVHLYRIDFKLMMIFTSSIPCSINKHEINYFTVSPISDQYHM